MSLVNSWLRSQWRPPALGRSAYCQSLLAAALHTWALDLLLRGKEEELMTAAAYFLLVNTSKRKCPSTATSSGRPAPRHSPSGDRRAPAPSTAA